MPQYETIVIMPPELGKNATKIAEKKLTEIIKKFDGEMKLVEDWGTRRTTFPIHKSSKAQFVYLNYLAGPDSQLEITRLFKIDENIWRFGSYRLEDDYDYLKAKQSYLPEAYEDPRKARRPMGGGGRGGFGGFGRGRDHRGDNDFGGGGAPDILEDVEGEETES